MSTDSSPTHLPPVELAAWLNGRLDGTLMGALGIRAVEVGPQRAEAKVVHGSKTLVVVETRVSSGDGRLLAIVNTTHFVRDSGGEQ